MPCGNTVPLPEFSYDELEIMLCSVCRTLERLNYDIDENPMLSKWWFKHKKIDNKLK